MFFIKWKYDSTFLGGTNVYKDFSWSSIKLAKSFDTIDAAQSYLDGSWENNIQIIYVHPLNVPYWKL